MFGNEKCICVSQLFYSDVERIFGVACFTSDIEIIYAISNVKK